MINVAKLISALKSSKIDFFTGVPDSILKEFCLKLDNFSDRKHIRASNEGNAVAVAAGYHLSNKKIPCVYMQNSGLGNAINPLASICHKDVYSIPMLLMIGWRGAPKMPKTEPQHMVKGRMTITLLRSLNIKYIILDTIKDLTKLKKLISYSKKNNSPVACLVRKSLYSSEKKEKIESNKSGIERIDAIKLLLEKIKKKTYIISTTGYTSRELHELESLKNYKFVKSFYNVGGMGHAASIALATSINKKKHTTICLDGDGSILMHLGSLNMIGKYAKNNFKHILFNNFSHQSVGSQKTNSEIVDFKTLCKSLNYRSYVRVKSLKEFNSKIDRFFKAKGPSFIEVVCNQSKSKKILGRPGNFKDRKKLFN